MTDLSNMQKMDHRNIKKALESLLWNKTSLTADTLLEADKKFKNETPSKEILERYGKSYRLSSAREFGLTVGPTIEFEQEELPSAQTLSNQFQPIQNLAGRQGLDEGRLDEGLITIIENYLNKKHELKGPVNEKNLTVYKNQLVDMLVRFAEKLLYIANNDSLLRPQSRTGQPSASHSNDSVHKYVTVLQSIGNSILIQADEYKYRDSYKEDIKRRFSYEINGLRQVYALDATRVINTLIINLEGGVSQQNTIIEKTEQTLSSQVNDILDEDIDFEKIGINNSNLDNLEALIEKTTHFIESSKTIKEDMDATGTKLKNLIDSLKLLNKEPARVINAKKEQNTIDFAQSAIDQFGKVHLEISEIKKRTAK